VSLINHRNCEINADNETGNAVAQEIVARDLAGNAPENFHSVKTAYFVPNCHPRENENPRPFSCPRAYVLLHARSVRIVRVLLKFVRLRYAINRSIRYESRIISGCSLINVPVSANNPHGCTNRGKPSNRDGRCRSSV
jgi:hypothetical protein